MLVLSRKLGQRFRIGTEISITIVKVDRHSVRIGIEAPCDVPICREELAPLELELEREAEPAARSEAA